MALPRRSSSPRDPGLLMLWCGNTAVLQPVRIPATGCTLGREIISRYGLTDDRSSLHHTRIAPVNGRFTVSDLDSRNGTFVDGREVSSASVAAPTVLRTGRTIWAIVEDVGLYERYLQGEPSAYGPLMAKVFRQALSAVRARKNLVITGGPGTGKLSLLCECADACGTMPVRINGASLVSSQLPGGAVTMSLSNPEAMDVVAQVTLGSWLDLRADLSIAILCERLSVYRAVLNPALVSRLEEVVVNLPPLRERPEELVAELVRVAAASAPGLELHCTLVEACLLRPWSTNFHGLVATITELAKHARALGAIELRSEDVPVGAGA